MKSTKIKDMLKYIAGAIVGAILYNLIFHNNEPLISTIMRGVIVGSTIGIIVYVLNHKQRR